LRITISIINKSGIGRNLRTIWFCIWRSTFWNY